MAGILGGNTVVAQGLAVAMAPASSKIGALLFSGNPDTAATMYGLSGTDGRNSRHVRKFDV